MRKQKSDEDTVYYLPIHTYTLKKDLFLGQNLFTYEQYIEYTLPCNLLSIVSLLAYSKHKDKKTIHFRLTRGLKLYFCLQLCLQHARS